MHTCLIERGAYTFMDATSDADGINDDDFGDFVAVEPAQSKVLTESSSKPAYPPGYIPGGSLFDTLTSSSPNIGSEQNKGEQNETSPKSLSEVSTTTPKLEAKPSSNGALLMDMFSSTQTDNSTLNDLKKDGNTSSSREGSTESNEFGQFSSEMDIPPPGDVLEFYYNHILHAVDGFFSKMVSLSYSQRRRVLTQSKTKHFFDNYCVVIRIAGMVMMGRMRTAIDAAQRTKANRRAKDVVWIWNQLAQRLKTMGLTQKLPVLDETYTLPEAHDGPFCLLCGLSKTEKFPREEGDVMQWTNNTDLQFHGHVQCLALWQNKSIFC